MSNGNKHQSEWSQAFHASRGDSSLPCPTIGAVNEGHPGTCKEAHPRGVGIRADGTWYTKPVTAEYLELLDSIR